MSGRSEQVLVQSSYAVEAQTESGQTRQSTERRSRNQQNIVVFKWQELEALQTLKRIIFNLLRKK